MANLMPVVPVLRSFDERKALEARVKLLYPESLDADMLEEWARRLLNYGLPDEAVVLDGDEDDAALKEPALQVPAGQ